MSQDTAKKKRAFLEAMKKTFGNISASCNIATITMPTYYNWRKDDEEFAKEVDSTNYKESRLDFIENKLIEKINKGDTTAIIFALKTIGKERGYVEKTHTDITTNGKDVNNSVVFVLPTKKQEGE